MVQIIKNVDLRPLVYFFKKKPHCPNFGSMFLSSDSTYILLSLYGFWFIDPKFGHLQGFKKILKVQDKPDDVFCEKKMAKIGLLQANKDKITWFYIG